jgi:hypothetical protein
MGSWSRQGRARENPWPQKDGAVRMVRDSQENDRRLCQGRWQTLEILALLKSQRLLFVSQSLIYITESAS